MLPNKMVTTLLAIVLAFPAAQSRAQDVVKVGIVMPMTGSFAAAGLQVLAGISLCIRQNGDSVAGKKIQLIVKDDASVPDLSKRMAQELIITDHVSVMGVGLTPNALAIAPLSREAKIPTVLMMSGTSTVTKASPYIVRTSFTLGQQSGIIAEWAVKNGSRQAVVVHSDFAPGTEAARVQLGVEPVSLGAPMLARHRYTRCVNDVGLDAARPPAAPPSEDAGCLDRLAKAASNSP